MKRDVENYTKNDIKVNGILAWLLWKDLPQERRNTKQAEKEENDRTP